MTDIDGETNPANDVTGTFGTLDWAADGTFTYTVNTADPDFIALSIGATATDSFTYTITDANGATATASLTVTVTGRNDAPVAVADTSSADATTTGSGDLTPGTPGQDFDIDGDAFSVTDIDGETNPANDVTGTYGTLDWAADGTFTYTVNTADPDFIALAIGATASDSFTYTITDSNGATATASLTVTVTGRNDAPVAVADTSSADATTTGSGDLTPGTPGQDFDIDGDAFSVTDIDGETNPANDVTGTYGTLDWAADGTFTYSVVTTADPDFIALGGWRNGDRQRSPTRSPMPTAQPPRPVSR